MQCGKEICWTWHVTFQARDSGIVALFQTTMYVVYLTYKDKSVQPGSNLVVAADTALIHKVVGAICAELRLPGGVLLWKVNRFNPFMFRLVT